MRPRIGLLLLVLLASAMTACGPGEVTTTTPPPPPTTPTPTPSPQWTPEEQGSIDAVQRYLEVWTDIGHDPAHKGMGQIRDVAGDPIANENTDQWTGWIENGWHLTGGPSFTPELVTSGAGDYQGQRYHVRGCYSIEEAQLVDTQGKPATNPSRTRTLSTYDVLHLKNGRYVVFDSTDQEKTC